MQAPDFDPMDAVAIFDLVNRQTGGMRTGSTGDVVQAYRCGGIYVPSEQHIRSLCDFVLAKLGRFKAPIHFIG